MTRMITKRFQSDHPDASKRDRIGVIVVGPGMFRREFVLDDKEAIQLRDNLDRIITRGPIGNKEVIKPVMVPCSCGLANTWDIYVDDEKVLDGEPFAVADAVRRALSGDADVQGWCVCLARDIRAKVLMEREKRNA